MNHWLQRLGEAPDALLGFFGVLAAVALWIGFTGLRRARQIEDVPTARVRSAPQGYIELTGKARALDGEPIIAPLSNTLCCWYRYRVERRGDRDWRMVDAGSSDGVFALDDATGTCLVDPEGAEVTSSHRKTWSGDNGMGGIPVHARLPSLGRTADMVVNVGSKVLGGLGGSGQYRYSESVILDGDPLYVIGEFHSLHAGGAEVDEKHLMTAILREWKQRPNELLQRFDRDGDGRIDVAEWESARDAAREEARREARVAMTEAPVHTLRQPRDGRLYLVSNLEEFDLLKRYRWQKRLGLAAFAALVALIVLAIGQRP